VLENRVLRRIFERTMRKEHGVEEICKMGNFIFFTPLSNIIT
jgi:hypothetical protein